MEEQVSVRELRQHLSVHLRRVQEGRTLAVTSRGERVALLVPLAGASRYDRLVAEGRLRAPLADGLPDALSGPGLTAAVLEERDLDER